MSTTDPVGNDSSIGLVSASKARLGADMSYIHYEVPGYQALHTIADIMEMVRVNVDDPDQIKLEVLGNEMRVKFGIKIIAQAKRPNGADLWIVQANHQICTHIASGVQTRPFFYF